MELIRRIIRRDRCQPCRQGRCEDCVWGDSAGNCCC